MATKPFQTQTVESNQTLVDDKLKPTAELQILVGGPYKSNGEEHRYGHTALRIKGQAIDWTYDFGRYGDVRGLFGESGDGILRVWSDFATYIKGENRSDVSRQASSTPSSITKSQRSKRTSMD